MNAFPQWQFWSDLVGAQHSERAYDFDELLEDYLDGNKYDGEP